ncbi:MAG: hypothetical protein JO023_10365 [Chloroflexi bacterium]|nr:hypothetical protein [Chloroflexota bacterium]
MLSGVLVLVAVLASAVSGSVHRGLAHGNDFVVLYPLELLALPLGAVAAARRLHAGRGAAPGLVGVGLYLLVVAGAVSTAYPLWLPSDNTILGSALLAGVLAGVGAYLALAGAAVLASWPSSRVAVVGAAGGVLAFLLVTVGGMVAPVWRLQVPLLVVAAMAMAALLLAGRRRPRVGRPLAAALAGGVCTVAVLLARGPGDWASASTSVKLYSFPIVVMALGLSLAMLDVVPLPDRQPDEP